MRIFLAYRKVSAALRLSDLDANATVSFAYAMSSLIGQRMVSNLKGEHETSQCTSISEWNAVVGEVLLVAQILVLYPGLPSCCKTGSSKAKLKQCMYIKLILLSYMWFTVLNVIDRKPCSTASLCLHLHPKHTLRPYRSPRA